MADQVRWGILSTANIGRGRVIPAMKHMKNGVVAAVGSRHLERAQAFAHELDIPKAYGSYEELIADPDIDAIYNPLPNSLHAEWSIKCAEAGKPTLCEKPLAGDAEEAQRMVDAFAERGVLFAEAFMYRFHPRTQRVRQMVADGAVGDVTMMNATFSFPVRDENNIRLSQPLAGGSLMDVGCYCVNAIRLMTGEEPVDVRAFGRWGARSQVEERIAGVLSLPSGALAHFDSSLRLQQAQMLEIRGAGGRLLLENAFTPGPDDDTVIRYWHGHDYEEIKIPAANQYTIMAEDFNDALLRNRPPKFPPQDAVNNMKVVDKLLAAAGS